MPDLTPPQEFVHSETEEFRRRMEAPGFFLPLNSLTSTYTMNDIAGQISGLQREVRLIKALRDLVDRVEKLRDVQEAPEFERARELLQEIG